MSSGNSNTNGTARTNQTTKDTGFSNFKAFSLSYGLRLGNPADVEEGKAILRSRNMPLLRNEAGMKLG
jgi:hypothetical protein